MAAWRGEGRGALGTDGEVPWLPPRERDFRKSHRVNALRDVRSQSGSFG